MRRIKSLKIIFQCCFYKSELMLYHLSEYFTETIYISQIYNWVPIVYNTTENLPAIMPDELKNSIAGEQLKPKDVS